MDKTILTFTLACLISTGVCAQRVEVKSFDVDRATTKIDLNLRFGRHIEVRAWDKDEVTFRAVIEINSGRLNDALLINYREDEAGLYISANYDKERMKEGRKSDCPDRWYSTYSWHENGKQQVVCSDITYTLMVPRRTNLTVESISADMELYGVAGPVHAKSISGFVDLSWPEQQGAEVSMKTISGEAYSNLENIAFLNRKKTPPIVGYELRGRIGDGGALIHLESISGDIYLRKE